MTALTTDPQERRKLAAIMFTDMVGYSAMTQRNEGLALELLDEHRKLLRPIFLKHQGREIETAGDAFFVEFGSALEAARCAIEIHKTLHERNSTASSDRTIRLRIGLHLGDVVYMDQHVHGDGVNIAARIEPLAYPGGICVSEDIAHQIQNKIDLPMVKLGQGELKNIQIPVRIYRILLPWEKRQFTYTDRLHFALKKKKTKIYALVALILAILSTIYFAVPSKTSADRKSIAVLPFRNMSEDRENDWFSEGLTDDIITQLQKIAKLKVTSRTSVMQYKNREEKSARDIGKELGVASLLEGSVRRDDKGILVVAHLIDAQNDNQLWAENYNRDLAQVWVIQSDVAKSIAQQLKATITPEEEAQLVKKTTGNLEAYDLYLRGRYYLNKRLPDSLKNSYDNFRGALEMDSLYALAYAGLSDYYTILGDFNLQPPERTYANAKAAAARAIEIDPKLCEGHTSLAYATMHFDWDWLKTEREFKRALELNSSSAVANSWYGIYLCAMGRFAEADTVRKRALELDPFSPVINADAGVISYFERRYDEAIAQFEKAIKLDPFLIAAYIPLGAAYEHNLMYKEALEKFGLASIFSRGHPVTVAALAHLAALTDKKDDAVTYLDLLKEKPPEVYVPPFYIAAVYTALGKKSQALDWLEKSYKEHDGSLIFLKVHPIFDSLRSEQRFTELLKKLGLEPEI